MIHVLVEVVKNIKNAVVVINNLLIEQNVLVKTVATLCKYWGCSGFIFRQNKTTERGLSVVLFCVKGEFFRNC